jgi:predicted ATPase
LHQCAFDEAVTLPPSQYLSAVSLNRGAVPDFGQFPFSLPVLHKLERLEMHPHVTFLIGENGSGKSTLLEALAVAWGFNAEGGSRNFRFSTRASHTELHRFLRLERGLKRARDGFFLRAESLYNLATEIERLDNEPGPGAPIIMAYGGKSLHEQSHGESFLTLFLERFHGSGFYILDEPEAALSPSRQLAILVRLDELVSAGAQFVIATHSPILMAYPRAKIVSIDETGLSEVCYEETEHFQLTRRFLHDYRGMLARLLAADDDETH